MTVTTGNVKQVDEVRAGGSYLSTSDPRLHFGLGSAVSFDRIEVLWPSGLREQFPEAPAIDFYHWWKAVAPRCPQSRLLERRNEIAKYGRVKFSQCGGRRLADQIKIAPHAPATTMGSGDSAPRQIVEYDLRHCQTSQHKAPI